MLITNLLNLGFESITLLTIPGEFIVLIIESLPGFTTVSVVPKSVFLVQLLNLGNCVTNQLEVIANHTLHLSSINKQQELGFYLSVEVAFYFGMGVTVHTNVVETLVFDHKVFVVFLDFSTHWVPSGCKVQTSIGWSELIQMVDHILHTAGFLAFTNVVAFVAQVSNFTFRSHLA